MARTTAKGFFVWDLTTDAFNHTQLAANWDLVDAQLDVPPKQVEILATVPTSGNFAGRLVMLSAAVSGFPAWTLIRYDGSAWRAVGPLEILPTVPTSGNYAGRVIILSAADSGFDAWSVIRYNGTTWATVGGFSQVNTGAGALNIKGLQTAEDVYWNASARGPVLVDRTDGSKWRIFIQSGKLLHEAVS